jgi:hypothetical protein
VPNAPWKERSRDIYIREKCFDNEIFLICFSLFILQTRCLYNIHGVFSALALLIAVFAAIPCFLSGTGTKKCIQDAI